MEIKLTSANYQEEVKASDHPVLIDFYADWCHPCQMLSPTISEIAEEYAGRIKVARVNVDEERELAIEFGIESIPTLIYMVNGELKERKIGFIPKEKITEMFK